MTNVSISHDLSEFRQYWNSLYKHVEVVLFTSYCCTASIIYGFIISKPLQTLNVALVYIIDSDSPSTTSGIFRLTGGINQT